MKDLHIQAGHLQLHDLLFTFQQSIFNPAARKLAKRVIRECASCELASTKSNGQTHYGPIRKPAFPFETIGIDLFGPLIRHASSDSAKYILTVVDRLTGYTQFLVIENSKSASICRALELFLLTVGQHTRTIISDNGRQFENSDEWKLLMSTWNIKHLRIPIYSPHAGGFYETKHKTAVHVLRTMLFDNPKRDWQLIATIASQQINARHSADRSSSPHELIFGYPHTWPILSAIQNTVNKTDPVPSNEVVDLQAKRHQLRDQLLKLWDTEFELRQESTAKRFLTKVPNTRQPLQIGDHVMFTNDTIKKKFDPQCTGPFLLISPNGHQSWNTVEIHTGRKFILHSRRLRFIDPENSLVTSTTPHEITTTIDPTPVSIEHAPEPTHETGTNDHNEPINTDQVPLVHFSETPTTRLFEPDSPPNSPLTILPHPSGYNLRERSKEKISTKTKYPSRH